MKPLPSPELLVRDLFREQDRIVTSMEYRHGWLRTAFILLRSIVFARVADRATYAIQPGSRVAFVIFENERRALAHAQTTLRLDRVVDLEMSSLGVVRSQLGTWGAILELLRFASSVVRVMGFSYLPRCAQPALGWMLYRAYGCLLAHTRDVTVVTTNLIHPTSLGIHWAGIADGQRTEFYEHATTPALIMHDRGYDQVYVNFEHTRRLMMSRGFDGERIKVSVAFDARARQVLDGPLNNVAVCINSHDSLRSILDITDEVARFGAKITYRIHDADSRVDEITALAARRGFDVSLARSLPIQAFLQTTDLVVVGNSNVVADALLAGKAVVYYWAGEHDMFDYYGFLLEYDVPHARTPQALREALARLVLNRLPKDDHTAIHERSQGHSSR
jgi:hypothetical protein